MKIMDPALNRKSKAKAIAFVILGGMIAAVVTTYAQVLMWGSAKAAITGGVVGAVTAALAISVMKNNKQENR
jgi:predicted MFS family arabinose efflux permease